MHYIISCSRMYTQTAVIGKESLHSLLYREEYHRIAREEVDNFWCLGEHNGTSKPIWATPPYGCTCHLSKWSSFSNLNKVYLVCVHPVFCFSEAASKERRVCTLISTTTTVANMATLYVNDHHNSIISKIKTTLVLLLWRSFYDAVATQPHRHLTVISYGP